MNTNWNGLARKKSTKKQMDEIVGVAVSVAPVVKEREKKVPFAEGGDVDAQMAIMMPTEEEPMMEEQEQDMMPDEQMEEEYLDFIIDQFKITKTIN